jgi:hypothetical protein
MWIVLPPRMIDVFSGGTDDRHLADRRMLGKVLLLTMIGLGDVNYSVPTASSPDCA